MVLSASAPYSLSNYGNSYYFVIRQVAFAVVGIALMLFASKIDYHIYKKFYKIAYWVAIVALMLVVVPGIGGRAKGATRWVELGALRFQPSELAKIFLIIFYAGYLTEHKNELGYFVKGCLKSFVPLIPPILILYFLQDHLSASVVIIAVVSIMMVMSGMKMKHFLSFGIAGGSAAVAGMLLLATIKGKGGFRIARIVSFLDPWADAQGDGYQVIQGLYAIGSGGLFGVGLGQSKQKYLYIPEPHNDFIFAIIAEELGFVRMFSSYSTICSTYLERSNNSNEGTRFIWKLNSSRNYFTCRNSSYYKYCSCNIINAKYRNVFAIYKLWWNSITYFINKYGSSAKYFKSRGESLMRW